jgi:MFS family permease
MMRFRGPLADSYAAAAAMVVCALVPYLGLSAALQPITPIIAKQLHLSQQAMQLTSGMANAAYAVGTVLAVQFAQHLRQRRMLLLYATLFVIGSILAAWAPLPGLFIAGHVVQGLCTSLMLIAAVPPLVIGWPVQKMRWTVAIMNMCIFGAVAVGPTVGGVQAAAHAWRPLFWIVAAIGALALLLSLLTYEDQGPQDRSAPWDAIAVALAASGCVAAFYGASELLTHPFLSPSAFGPLLGGVALLVLLLLNQYHARRPLLTIRDLASTIPVAGIVVAVCAAAAAVSATELIGQALAQRYSPLHLGLLFFPEFGGAVISAVAFAALHRRRGIHLLALLGMLLLGAGIAVMNALTPPSAPLTLIGSGLIGVGLGASVAPALFIAGWSLRSQAVQRVFALVELMRAVAAFMIAPILIHLAVTVGDSSRNGTAIAMWICFGIVIGGALLGVYLYALGRVRPQAPDLERWLEGDRGAWESPPLLDGIRGDSTERALAELLGDRHPSTPDGARRRVVAHRASAP